MTLDPAVRLLIEIAIAVLFAGSAVTKFVDLEVFQGAMANYALMPRVLEKPAAVAIPVAEFLSAVAFFIPGMNELGVFTICGLLLIFTAAVAINLVRGRVDIDCGCFGPALRQKLSAWMLVRNAVLIAAALALFLPASTRPIGAIDPITCAAGASAALLIYMAANYALANLPTTRALEAT